MNETSLLTTFSVPGPEALPFVFTTERSDFRAELARGDWAQVAPAKLPGPTVETRAQASSHPPAEPLPPEPGVGTKFGFYLQPWEQELSPTDLWLNSSLIPKKFLNPDHSGPPAP